MHWATGSPPQVRGKLVNRSLRAETTVDHPRRCGENITSMFLLPAAIGSPPQVRGKRVVEGLIAAIPRITPAGAGKTPLIRSAKSVPKDHPRRCGENVFRKRLNPWRKGSPPQVRGKPVWGDPSIGKYRITPAGAGKTYRYPTFDRALQDHPRRCGENLTVCRIVTFRPGSPPQVRGKLKTNERKEKPIGITPAGAGKT